MCNLCRAFFKFSIMSILALGTVAFDSIETPFGKVDKVIGGASTYISWAASYFYSDINMVSIIGDDFPEYELEALRKRGINTDAIQKVPNKKSFFWAGKYHDDLNNRDTLVTELNVLADFDPVLPPAVQESQFVMLGNLTPRIQISVLNQLAAPPKITVLDTMNFWMDTAMEELREVIAMVDVLTINDEEARLLTGKYSLVVAAAEILDMGPKYLIVKKGEHGALLFSKQGLFFAPALPLETVKDPTGAGDSFAGGFVGYLAKTNDLSFENVKKAVVCGSVLASFCVEEFSLDKIRALDENIIKERLHKYKELTKFDIPSW